MTGERITGAPLNYEIAKARGWTDLQLGKGPEVYWIGFDPEGEGYAEVVPDWANDMSEALALCLEIAEVNNYELVLHKYHSGVTASYQGAFHENHVASERGDTPALALARLALRAVRILEAE